MKPSEYIKSFGFESMDWLAKKIGKPGNTIANWYNSKDNRIILDLVIKGLLAEKDELLRITAINQFTSFDKNELIAVHFEGGLTLYKDYPYPLNTLDDSKESQLQRKIFFHNFCVMYHKGSALNAAQLKRLEEQKEKIGI